MMCYAGETNKKHVFCVVAQVVQRETREISLMINRRRLELRKKLERSENTHASVEICQNNDHGFCMSQEASLL